jgi:hypothetical protein
MHAFMLVRVYTCLAGLVNAKLRVLLYTRKKRCRELHTGESDAHCDYFGNACIILVCREAYQNIR